MPNPSMIAMADEEATAAFTPSVDGGGADLTKPYWYLAGPMSNLPKFNFPAFMEHAGKLRETGLNICNPAEFDHEIARSILASKDGSHRKLSANLKKRGLNALTWADCLRRDIVYVGNPNCQGVIVMDGWEFSQGAQFETYVAYKLLKPVQKLEYAQDGTPVLEAIDRRSALDAAGVIDG